MAATRVCHLVRAGAVAGAVVAFLGALSLFRVKVAPNVLLGSRSLRMVNGKPPPAEGGGRLEGLMPTKGGRPTGPLGWPRLPLRDSSWHDEEQSQLRRILRPRRLASLLRGVSDGSPPRRALYSRPSSCVGKQPHYPPASYSEEQLLTWRPHPDRFILAICHYGELNNQLVCMDKYFLFAALLNRTLVIPRGSFEPTARYNWTWDLAVDIAHANACLGPGAVLTLDDLRARLGGPPAVAIDRHVCFLDKPGMCKPPSVWKLEGQNVSAPAGPPTVVGALNLARAEFLARFGNDSARVITFNDLYGPNILGVPHHRPYWPIRPRRGGNESYIRAHTAIRAAADGIVRALLGGNFLAMHLRRGDFYKSCMKRGNNCFWPDIPVVARVLAKHAAALNITRVYVATNAHLEEVELLDKLLAGQGRPLELVVLPRLAALPDSSGARAWAGGWLDLGLDDNEFATAILDKLVCTRAAVFVGSAGSTFSADVYRIRWAQGRALCDDGDPEELKRNPSTW